MIRVRRPKPPSELYSPGSPGPSEAARAISFFADPRNHDQPFEFRAYKLPVVGPTLTGAFNGKCAYCESTYEATAPVDVEHYRPKGAVVADGALRRPGYYWLAAEWENLLPSCIDCNRERTQHFGSADPRVSGKANRFPLRTEARRARAPGEERREERLLLHPYRDLPERHLKFLTDGIVRARRSAGRVSAKGRATIETVGLERDGLVRARAALAKTIQVNITLARQLSELAAANPGGAADVSLQIVLEQLKAACDPGRPYAAMARQLISAGLELG